MENEFYNLKKISWGTEEVIVKHYALPIQSGLKARNRQNRKKVEEMSDSEKEAAKKRRKAYLKAQTERYAMWACNPANNLNTMITLTLADDSAVYACDEKAFAIKVKQFLERLERRLKCNKNEIIYLFTIEKQKKRNDVLHAHMLINQRLEHSIVSDVWGLGYVWLTKADTQKAKLYALKYLCKDYSTEAYKHVVHYSRNIIKESVVTDLIDSLDDFIFLHADEIENFAQFEISRNNQKINKITKMTILL